MVAPHSARLPLLALSLAPVRGPALVPFSLALSDAASEAKVTCQVMGIICARAGGPVWHGSVFAPPNRSSLRFRLLFARSVVTNGPWR